MFRLVTRRLLESLPTLLVVSIVAFLMIRLAPGDPVQIMLGERGGSPEVVAEIKKNLGLDRPLWVQYGLFIKRAVQGDLGVSIISKEPVLAEFWARFPATFELGIAGIFLAVVIGIPFGLIAAVKRNSVFDYSLMAVSVVGYSMPIFWWGLLLILFFSVGLGWLPVSGRLNEILDVDHVTGFLLVDSLLSEDGGKIFWDAVKHLILPALALGTIPLAAIARMTRASVLEVLKEDYIRTAKAKGLPPIRVVLRHAFRNAIIPVVTVIGLMVGTVLTGAILTETIFSWPGIGRWIVNSVSSRDYPVVQGALLLICITILIVNLIVDLICGMLNPHMRS